MGPAVPRRSNSQLRFRPRVFQARKTMGQNVILGRIFAKHFIQK